MDGMESFLSVLPRRLHNLGWAAAWPLATAAILFGLLGADSRTALVIVLLTVAVTLAVPVVAADLMTVTVLGAGVYAFLLALDFFSIAHPLPDSGSLLYPLVSDGPGFDMVAGSALAVFGLWLVPRTIGLHSGLARRNGELAVRVGRLTATRVDAVDSAAAELRRVERDLHDGAQARLVALGISLRAMERLISVNPAAAAVLAAEARENSARALAELRALVRGINPPVLAERGLGDAIRALALDCPLATTTDIDLPQRLPAPVETAAYFAVAEALANTAKHAGARTVHIRAAHIRAARSAGLLRIEVTDDGAGGADPARGSGLRGVERRLGTFDGVLAISSPPGGPTIVVIEVPCAL
jgi:signal transduction histidine kinase